MKKPIRILSCLLVSLVFLSEINAQNQQVFSKLDSIVEANEFNYRTHTLTLRPGITWLSFPRLQERDNNGYCNYTKVFEDNLNIIPNNHNYLELENVPPRSENSVYLFWNPQYNWNPQGLSAINSTLGYKLNLQPEQERELLIKGALPKPGQPEAYVHLYAGYENWVGYFLPQTQQIFDIIPESVYDDIIEIKHQDWSIYNTQLPGPPSPDGTCPGGWKCGDNTHLMVRYGDMLIIRTYSLGSDHTFQWLPYTRTSDAETAEASYFTYDEKADYEAVFIELDTTTNPLEIGAFVNDTCIGAAAIGQDDSLVQLRAYTDPSNVGDIVFQQYDGLKSAPAKITEYLVEDPDTGIFNKRKIHSSEKQLYHTVSFRKDKKANCNSGEQQKPMLTCLPNPVKDNCNIRYSVVAESNVSLKVFDLFGRLQQVIYEGNSKAGKYQLEWIPEDAFGGKLSKGMYIIRLETVDGHAQEKVMIL